LAFRVVSLVSEETRRQIISQDWTYGNRKLGYTNSGYCRLFRD
jgi:hypothetical protein